MNNFMNKIVIYLGLAASAAGAVNAIESNAASKKPIRMVYFQGLNSCDYKYDLPIHRFKVHTQNHPDAKLYWGCFDGGIMEHPLDKKEHFYLKVLDKNGWSKLQEMEPQTAPLEIMAMLIKEVKRANPNAFNTELNPNPTPEMDLFITGHSHGGWLAMRLANLFYNRPQFELQELLTIDPISYTLCQSKHIPFNFFSTSFSRLRQTEHNCLRAPKDLEDLERFINEASHNRWTNYYQNIMTYVASGPIMGATTNLISDAYSEEDWYWAHCSILREPRAWARFFRRLIETVEQ